MTDVRAETAIIKSEGALEHARNAHQLSIFAVLFAFASLAFSLWTMFYD